MNNLQDIKDRYYADLANLDVMGLDEYIRTYYMPCYDEHLNFLGYDRKSGDESLL